MFNPPLFYLNGYPKCLDISTPPLGLLYLASYINKKSKNFHAKIFDLGHFHLSFDQLEQEITQLNPFAFGVTSMTPQLQGTITLASFLKKHFPSTPLFLGGPHISADPDFINRHPNLFDYAIAGEAEITFLDSLNKLYLHRPLPKFQHSQWPQDLNKLPIPDRSLIDRPKYNQTESLLYSRGCPFNCYYCSRPSIAKMVRYRSTYSLIREIKSTMPFCHGLYNFQDDTFTFNRSKVLKLTQKLIQSKLKIKWQCNTRIDLVDFNLLKSMKKAGCDQINFGIESGSERVRQAVIHKGNFTNQDIERVFKWCHRLNIKIACYFMIGHPSETLKEIGETESLIKKAHIDILGLSIPTPFPGSELYEIAKKEKIISPQIIDDFAYGRLGVGYQGIYPVYIPSQIGRNRLFECYQKINRNFYLKPIFILKQFIYSIRHPALLKNNIIDFISLVKNGASSRKPYLNKKQ